MSKGTHSRVLVMTVLLLVLTVFFQTGCRTVRGAAQADIDAVIQNIAPEKPAVPYMEPVVFEDKDGGLWLSYDAYRALERNIISLKEYASRLEVIIAFWEER